MADNEVVAAIKDWFKETVMPIITKLTDSVAMLTVAANALDTTVKVLNNRVTRIEQDIKSVCDTLQKHSGELSQHSEALGRLMERDSAAANIIEMRARSQDVRNGAQEREIFWNRERIWALFEKLAMIGAVAGAIYAVAQTMGK